MIGPGGSIVYCSPLNTYGGMSLKSMDFAAIRLGCWLKNLGHLGIGATRFTLECTALGRLSARYSASLTR